jgi:hypothetical protein
MISLPNPKSKMTMTKEQLDQFKFNYAEMIVDQMDMGDLITLAVESIEQNLKDYTEQELKEEILDLYDEDVLNGIIGGNI